MTAAQLLNLGTTTDRFPYLAGLIFGPSYPFAGLGVNPSADRPADTSVEAPDGVRGFAGKDDDFPGASASGFLGDRSPPASCSAVVPNNFHISICAFASSMSSTSCLPSELSTAAFDDAQILFTETANDCSDPH